MPSERFMRHWYGSSQGEPAKSIEITGIWLRRLGEHAEALFERDGKWHLAIMEPLDSNFSCIIEPTGMLECPEDDVTTSQEE